MSKESNVVLNILIRNANQGRKEQTGDTHILYCYWEQNQKAYKTTVGCNCENYYAQLISLVELASSSALNKGATNVEVKFKPDVLVCPRGGVNE